MQNSSRHANTFVIIAILLYLCAGIFTQYRLMQIRPLQTTLLDDYQAYHEAYQNALNNINPYQGRLGSVFLYPPPALLIPDVFGHIPSRLVRGIVLVTLNVTLLLIMVYGVAKYYGIPIKSVWYWFPLALGFAPFLEMLQIGQINMLVLFGVFLLFYFETSLPFLAGLGLGGAILTKVTPIFFTGYLLARKNIKVLLFLFLTMAAITLITLYRYGSDPFLQYRNAFPRMLKLFPTSIHAHSLGARLTYFGFPKEQVFLVQRILLFYFFLVLGLSCFITLLLGNKEPLFILTGFAMAFSPNILWYHHYVFLLLPIFIWMGYRRDKPLVLLWCFFGLLLIQIDRWLLTRGLLIHVFGHASILGILLWQINSLIKSQKVAIFNKSYLARRKT